MGTRGLIGFKADGQSRWQYNQYDMYPDGHGLDCLRWLRASLDSVSAAKARIVALVQVEESGTPDDETMQRLVEGGFADRGVSTGSDWYAALRNCQGNIPLTLESGYITGSEDFGEDSLFCEWAYILDFDGQTFEVYKGFQTTPADDIYASLGHWYNRKPIEDQERRSDTYYPVALVGMWSFDSLPSDEQFLAASEKWVSQ